ncbi:MAG: penicillin-binding transpeptidase domain-containing protein, partial [Candidatus Dormibacteria bacterium]
AFTLLMDRMANLQIPGPRRPPLGVVVPLLLLVAACAAPRPAADPGRNVVQAFAREWERQDSAAYARMYGMLTAGTRKDVTAQAFTDRYAAVSDRMALERVRVAVGSTPQGAVGGSESVPVTVTYTTTYAGEFRRSFTITATLESGSWRLRWAPEQILPELAHGGHLREEHQLLHRGSILARDGSPLALTRDDALQVGVVTGKIKDEAALLKALAPPLGLTADEIKRRYGGGQPEWFMPVRLLPPGTPEQLHSELAAIPGVDARLVTARFYPQGSTAAHLLGYVGPDGRGRSGLEKSLDAILAGTPGGRLYVVDDQERETATVASRLPVAGSDVTLTIDLKVQQAAETAMKLDARVAVVAEDPRSGQLLAIASRPTFDPNAFVYGRDAEVAGYQSDPTSPLLFRATSGQYPAGSIFKPITAAAALGPGLITPQEKIGCPHHWEGYGPPGQDNHESGDLGAIDLSTAIARSCNTYFYEVGKRLNDRDPRLLGAVARSFGLGSPTGLRYVPEESGKVPSPRVPGDATNLAIGQGGLLVTPLQMANYMAALSAGGRLPVPTVVRVGAAVVGASPAPVTPVPSARAARVRQGDLTVILDAMRRVVADPVGTLHLAFSPGSPLFYGKSGTAETSPGAPDIWFVGGAELGNPSVVVAVVVEEKPNGVHSLDAATIGRRVLEAALKAA